MRIPIITPGLLAATVLVAAVWQPGVVKDPWGSCPTTGPAPAACNQAPQASDPTAGILTAAAGHYCLPAAQWPHTAIPAGAVMRTGTTYAWEPFAVAWGMAHRGSWTIDLCTH